jgi:Flavodoxins
MNIELRYFSRGGNTQKVAEAIAKKAKIEAKDCSKPITKTVDLLFLGGSVYGFGLDGALKKFVRELDPEKVKMVALFGTSAIIKSGNKEMRKLLSDKGIIVMEKEFYCRGSFTLMNMGSPNDKDLKRAAEFARDVLNELN